MAATKLFAINEDISLEHIVASIIRFLSEDKKMVSEVILQPDGIILQSKSKEQLKSLVGMSLATQIQFESCDDKLCVNIGSGKWIDKAVVAGVGFLTPIGAVTLATSAFGAWQQKKLPDEILCKIQNIIQNGNCVASKEDYNTVFKGVSGDEIYVYAVKSVNERQKIELLKFAAENNSYKAAIELGNLYYEGQRVSKDLCKAVEYWERCSKHLDEDISLKLADMYRDGDSIEKNLKKAFQFYQNVSKNDFIQRVIEIYEQGTDLPEYLKAVASIYEERFEAGEKQLLGKIIEIYSKLKDSENQQKWQIVKAKNGDIELALNLGKKLYEEDQKESVELLTIAAQKEDTIALRMLGEAYWNGDLVQEDDEKAIPLLQKAAQKGSLNAAEILVIHYDEYDEDDVKLLRALEQEIALFESGKYVDKDEDFSLSDELYKLAWLYCSGGEKDEIPRNVSKGIELFLKAIELGDTDSYLSLAEIYSEEEYGTVDYDKAIAYCKKAVDADVENAENMLKNILKEQKTAKQLSEFQNMLQCYKDDQTGEVSLKLAKAYEHGKCVKKDISQAITFYQDAVEKCNIEATFLLGKIYADGKLVKNKEQEAMVLLEKACASGWKGAEDILAENKEKLLLSRLKNCTTNNAGILHPQTYDEVESSLTVIANMNDLNRIRRRIRWIFKSDDDKKTVDILEKRYRDGSVISGLLLCIYYMEHENNYETIAKILENFKAFLIDLTGVRYKEDNYGCTYIENKIIKFLYVIWQKLNHKDKLSSAELNIANKLFEFFFEASCFIYSTNNVFLECVLAIAEQKKHFDFTSEQLTEKIYEYGLRYFSKNNGKWSGPLGICYPYHIIFTGVYHWKNIDYTEKDTDIVIGSEKTYFDCLDKFERDFSTNPNGDNALKLAALYSIGKENPFIVKISGNEPHDFSMRGPINYGIDTSFCEKIKYYLNVAANEYNNAVAQCILGDLHSDQHSELENIEYNTDIAYQYYTKSALNGCEIAAVRMIRKWKNNKDIIQFAEKYFNVFPHTCAANELRSRLFDIFIDDGGENSALWKLIASGIFDFSNKFSDFDADECNLWSAKLAEVGVIKALTYIHDSENQNFEQFVNTGEMLARYGYIDDVLVEYTYYLNNNDHCDAGLSIALFGCELMSQDCYALTGDIYCAKKEFDKAVDFLIKADGYRAYMCLAELSMKDKLKNHNEKSAVHFGKLAFARAWENEEYGQAASFIAMSYGMLFLKEFSKIIINDKQKMEEYLQQMYYWFDKAKEYECFIAQEIVDAIEEEIEKKKQKQEQYSKIWKRLKQAGNMIKQDIEEFNRETQNAVIDLEKRSDDYLLDVEKAFLSSKYEKIAARKLLKDRGIDIFNL